MRNVTETKSGQPTTGLRLTLRQSKLLKLIALGARSPDGLRAELYGANGTRLASTEARNIAAGLAVLVSRGLVGAASSGSYAITRKGRRWLSEK
jgi:hypothetical protein